MKTTYRKKWFSLIFPALLLALCACDQGSDSQENDDEERGDDTEAKDTGANDSESESPGDSKCGTEDAACNPDETKPCNEIETFYEGETTATCLPDCSGFDTDQCHYEAPELYGDLSIDLSSDFIMDALRVDEQGYPNAHEEAIIKSESSFSGTIAGEVYPSPDAVDYELWMMRAPGEGKGTVFIAVQYSFDANENLINPTVELRITGDHWTTGDGGEICMGQGNSIYVYNLSPNFKIECMHAVSGDAMMNIESAEQLTEPEGGKIHVTANSVPIYHVEDTEHGDLTDQLSHPACQRLDS